MVTMKNRILILFALIANLCVSAQTQTELNIGFPTGDSSNIYSMGVDIRGNYMFSITDELTVGPSLGVLLYIGKKYDDSILLASTKERYNALLCFPLAVRGEYTFSESFVTGLGIGYAYCFDVEEGDIGANGFYIRPSLGYLITERLVAQASYSSISSNGAAVSHFGLGLVFSK